MIDKQIRVDPRLTEVFKKIRMERGKRGLDKDPRVLSDRELTKMVLNAPSFPKVKEELITIFRKEELK